MKREIMVQHNNKHVYKFQWCEHITTFTKTNCSKRNDDKTYTRTDYEIKRHSTIVVVKLQKSMHINWKLSKLRLQGNKTGSIKPIATKISN